MYKQTLNEINFLWGFLQQLLYINFKSRTGLKFCTYVDTAHVGKIWGIIIDYPKMKCSQKE